MSPKKFWYLNFATTFLKLFFWSLQVNINIKLNKIFKNPCFRACATVLKSLNCKSLDNTGKCRSNLGNVEVTFFIFLELQRRFAENKSWYVLILFSFFYFDLNDCIENLNDFVFLSWKLCTQSHFIVFVAKNKIQEHWQFSPSFSRKISKIHTFLIQKKGPLDLGFWRDVLQISLLP